MSLPPAWRVAPSRSRRGDRRGEAPGVRRVTPPPPASRTPLLLVVALAVVLGGLGPGARAEARSARCEQLRTHPAVVAWTRAVAQAPDAALLDLTRERWLGEGARGAAPGEAPVRVVAVDLPPGAPLVDAACALAQNLDLERGAILIVAARVGLHAVSPALEYNLVRALARRHNAALEADPPAAARAFAEDLRQAARQEQVERDTLGAVGLAALVLGVLAALIIYRRGGALATPRPDA